MARASREKGKRGEREVAELLRAHGFDARRDGRLDVDLVHNVAGVHFEVKRCERYDVRAWARQAELDAPPECIPVVVYRSSGDVWRASLPFTALCGLLALAAEALTELPRP